MCRALLAVVKGTGSPVEQKLRIRCGAVCKGKLMSASLLVPSYQAAIGP